MRTKGPKVSGAHNELHRQIKPPDALFIIPIPSNNM
jgi:hypothetical protein